MTRLALFYLALTLGVTALLLFWLRRPGVARAETVWALAALLPLLVALAVGLRFAVSPS